MLNIILIAEDFNNRRIQYFSLVYSLILIPIYNSQKKIQNSSLKSI